MLATQPGDGPLVITRDELNLLIERLGSVMKLLLRADASERRAIYSELGMRLEYHRCEGREKVTAALGVEFYRVGGGT